MLLGMEVGLGPGHTVLHGDPAALQKGTAPNFWPMSAVPNGRPFQLVLSTSFSFWATVCKTVCPMLSNRFLSCLSCV